MMRFQRRGEPKKFDERCRQRGQAWLASHPGYDRPHDYWSEFEPELRDVFGGYCAYCVMFVFKAQTDHFIPIAVLKQKNKDELAYEWKNFRYGEGVLNGRKSKHIVLDPFQVHDEWFEMKLPSLQLVLTDKVPKAKKKIADLTMEKLGLQDDEVVIRYRRKWFEQYQDRNLKLEGLKDFAPLIARAVEADLEKGIDWRKPEKAV